jgi:flavin reductase (DIM6/NTAB) family NADH-FMN oxidoreductase RutF
VEYAARDVMNASSATVDRDVDEFELAGIDKAACDTIAASRVANAPASLECKVTQIIQLEGESNFAVFGEVTGIHMRDDCIVDGRFDVTRYQPLTRLGYRDYGVIKEVFSLTRPDD